MAVVTSIHRRLPDNDTFGGRLSRTRDAQGLTTTQLARRVGVPKKTIEQWESDRSEPGVERLSLVAGVLNVNMLWLLHGVGDAPEDDIGPDPLAAVTMQLERLKHMHEDTGRIIQRIQRELVRLEAER
ncbi:helix-turn-helix domain-containing protein [Mesorhizobium xinjiangense]|uniref:helix-turn-helix domain-containing protein n=1 Tax=Mesorhizobium xinjiangense TaxID=2678685 RepID=UPI0012ED307B|nr:helix-turn-helix transcriptional regulator [Mesorhizobium xinjiangense]